MKARLFWASIISEFVTLKHYSITMKAEFFLPQNLMDRFLVKKGIKKYIIILQINLTRKAFTKEGIFVS